MKSFENITTDINLNDGSGELKKFTYADMIKILVLPQTKQGGYTYEDVDHRVRIKKVVDSSNGSIDLEDADFNYLKGLVASTKWAFFHEDILKFKEDILSIK